MADGQVINPSSSVPAPLPPYPEQILAAIEALDKGKGAQETAISKHIEDAYGPMPEDHSALLSHHLNKMKQSGELMMLKNNYMKAGRDEFPFPPYPVLIVEAIEAVDKENGASKRAAHHLNK